MALAASIGVLLGSIAGFTAGKIDKLIMRFTDIILCFPTLLVILSVVTIVGPSIFNVMVVIGGFSWPSFCRLVRGQFLSLRQQDFVIAARSAGAKSSLIIVRHLLPNVVAPVSVAITLGLASAILTEASLSFLGLSVQVPTPSWGNMLFGATSISIIERAWWLWLPPGLLSPAPCWRSTSSAMGCAMPSIPACAWTNPSHTKGRTVEMTDFGNSYMTWTAARPQHPRAGAQALEQ